MNPLVIPLSIGKEDTFRVTWKNRLYQCKSAFVLPRKITTQIDVDEVVESAQIVLKLSEFAGALRSKMLSLLSDKPQSSENKSELIGLVIRVNIKSGKTLFIEDARRAFVDSPNATVDFMSPSALTIPLDDAARDDLIRSLDKSLTAPVLEALRQPFVAFLPTLSESWKNQQLETIQADKLVPFQMLFPSAQPIERFSDGERFIIDDLYCTNPTCNCTDITCVVLKTMNTTGQEVAWGGFKWSVETEKFKPLPQFSNKFNAGEWFKQFDKSSAVDLKFLLRARQTFMRKEFIAARKARKA
ncbi:hypothetical protein EBU99_12880 [bacterium]|nr:hypothetical protein [bacterium]